MDIWIDAETGTYGIANELYLLHVNSGEGIDDILDALTDYQIGYLAKCFGKKVIDHIAYDFPHPM